MIRNAWAFVLIVLVCLVANQEAFGDQASAELLQSIQGDWQRTVEQDGTKIRVVKSISEKHETLTYYVGERAVYAHRIDIKVSVTKGVNLFSFENMIVTVGPDAGERKEDSGSYVFKLDDDAWYEVHRMLPGEKGAPWINKYERVK